MNYEIKYWHKLRRRRRKAIRLGVMATVAALGVAYFLKSDRTRGAREKAKAWADDFHDEVMRKAKRAKNLTQEEYGRMVDIAAEHYRNLKDVSLSELTDAIDELKDEWEYVKDQMDDADDDDE